ncbi:MAG: methyltransferase domain-containing protein [Planctomycetia bacterium]
MNRFLRGVAESMIGAFPLPEPILEIGSYQVDGQEDLVDLRSLFRGREYVGVDFRPGPGVDCVASVEDLPQETGSVGTVVAFSTFEHVQRFWLGFEEVYRVLRPDGVFLVACPFYFRQHAFPSDYWRFTPQALEVLLEKYPTRILGWHGPEKRPLNVWAAAFREEATVSAEQFAKYQELLRTRATEGPLPPVRRLRYELGRILCGSRPFACDLERDRWSTELQRSTAA